MLEHIAAGSILFDKTKAQLAGWGEGIQSEVHSHYNFIHNRNRKKPMIFNLHN